MVDIVGRGVVLVKSQLEKSSIDQTGSRIGKGLKKGALIGVAALGTLAAGGVKASLAFEEAESVQRKLNNTLGNMKKTGAIESVDALSSSLMKKTGVDDEVIKRSQTILATFSEVASSAGDMGGAFERASRLALDLGASGFGNAESGAKVLGKALQDPIKGVTALSRAGVTFSAVQKQQIEDFIKTGEVAKAQNLVLAEVEKQVGGNAEAGAKGSDKLRNAFGELEEAFGKVLNKVTGGDNFSSLAENINDVADAVDRFADSKGLQGFLDAVDALMGVEPEPVGTGTVLADGVDPSKNSKLQTALDAAGVKAQESWGEGFLRQYGENTRSEFEALINGLDFTFGSEPGDLFPDIADGGLIDGVSNTLEEWETKTKTTIANIKADIADGGIFDGASQNLEDAEVKITEIWGRLKTSSGETAGNIRTRFSEGFTAIRANASSRLNSIRDQIRNLPGVIRNKASDWYNAGKTLIQRFWDGLTSRVSGGVSDFIQNLKDRLNNALGLPRTFFEGRDGIPTLRIPAFAGGGYSPGGLALVGEQGPEVVSLPRHSRVHSNAESERMVGGDTFVYNLYGPNSLAEARRNGFWARTYGTRFGAAAAAGGF